MSLTVTRDQEDKRRGRLALRLARGSAYSKRSSTHEDTAGVLTCTTASAPRGRNDGPVPPGPQSLQTVAGAQSALDACSLKS